MEPRRLASVLALANLFASGSPVAVSRTSVAQRLNSASLGSGVELGLSQGAVEQA